MKHVLLALLLPLSLLAQHSGSVKMEVKPFPTLPGKDYKVDQFVKSSASNYSLSEYQTEWFYWTNYSRSNPKRFWDSVVGPFLKVYPEMQSQYTKSLKKDLYLISTLPFLKPNYALLNMAQKHATSLASIKANPSHTSPNGSTFQDRVQKASIQKCAGENISFGPRNAVLGLVLLYIDQGVPDLGHRLSLLNDSFSEMGIGISAYSNNYLMVVQDFSCNQNP